MPYSEEERTLLKQLARQSIAYALEHSSPHSQPDELIIDINDYPESLREKRATFVTLHIHDDLRGCIGTLEARQALVKDVVYNAYAAAFNDPRFPPLSKAEFNDLDIHISILSPPEPMEFDSEADLLQQIRPGVDGLILEDGQYRGTFLPSVWESLDTPEEFLFHLKHKAGMPGGYWSDTVQVSRYTTESF